MPTYEYEKSRILDSWETVQSLSVQLTMSHPWMMHLGCIMLRYQTWASQTGRIRW